MVDKKQLNQTIREIRQSKRVPFQMANETLADEIWPYIQKKMPEVQLVKCGICQWFVTKNQKKYLLLELRCLKENAEKKLAEIEGAIMDLNKE